MSQNYRDLAKIASEIQQKVAPRGGKIQRILSSPASLCFLVRVPGETLKIYLGRGDGFGGLWLGQKTVPSTNRIQDKFLELMRKEMKNAILTSLEVDPYDRILTFNLIHKRKSKAIGFFIKRNDLFFAIESEKTILKSWVGKRQSRNKGDPTLKSEVFNEVGKKAQPFDSEGTLKEWTPSLEELWGEHLKKKEKMSKRLKFLQRKWKNITGDLDKAAKWRELKRIAEEGAFEDPTPPHIMVEGVKIPISGSESRGKVKDLIFEKVKSLRKGEEIQRKRASEVERQIENLKGEGDTKKDVSVTYEFSKTLHPVWKTPENKTLSQNSKTNQEYQVEYYQVGEHKLAIGREVRANDYLRNSWGKREDIWLHIDGERSSHIVLKVDNLFSLSDQQLKAVASLLADKSGFNGLEIPVLYSQLNGVKGVKGAPGKVLLKKPKYLTLAYTKNWPEILSRL